MPMDAGDHRLRQPAEPRHRLCALGEERPVIVQVRVPAHLLEIVARGKGGAGPGQHHDAHRRLVGEAIDLGRQFVDQRLRKRIELARTVEGEGRDLPLVPAEEDRLVVSRDGRG